MTDWRRELDLDRLPSLDTIIDALGGRCKHCGDSEDAATPGAGICTPCRFAHAHDRGFGQALVDKWQERQNAYAPGHWEGALPRVRESMARMILRAYAKSIRDANGGELARTRTALSRCVHVIEDHCGGEYDAADRDALQRARGVLDGAVWKSRDEILATPVDCGPEPLASTVVGEIQRETLTDKPPLPPWFDEAVTQYGEDAVRCKLQALAESGQEWMNMEHQWSFDGEEDDALAANIGPVPPRRGS